MQVSQSYGIRRPLEIAAKLVALRALMPAPVAPVLALVPAPVAPQITTPAAPLETRAERAAEIAAQQAERAAIRADLPTLRAAALEATYHGNGPTWGEVAALESRLSDLDDYLIFEIDPADTRADELPLAA